MFYIYCKELVESSKTVTHLCYFQSNHCEIFYAYVVKIKELNTDIFNFAVSIVLEIVNQKLIKLAAALLRICMKRCRAVYLDIKEALQLFCYISTQVFVYIMFMFTEIKEKRKFYAARHLFIKIVL